MAIDPHVAATHFRIQMAGIAAERAITFLKSREVFRGRMALQEVVDNLGHARDYLQASGQYPQYLDYIDTLIQFYKGQMATAVRPMQAPGVSEAVYNAQGNLLMADPVFSIAGITARLAGTEPPI